MNVSSLAFKNLKRNITRSWLLLSIVATVSCVLFTATLLLKSVSNAVRQGTDRLGADIMVVPDTAEENAKATLLAGEPAGFLMDKTVFDRVKKIQGVKNASPQLFIMPAALSCCFTVNAFLVAVDPDTDFTVRPWLKKNLNRELVPNEIIAGSAIPVEIGETIPFYGTAFHVVGTMEPTGIDFFDRTAFMSFESAYQMVEDSTVKAVRSKIGRKRISTVLVRTNGDATPGQIAQRIEQDVPGVRALVSDTVISTVKKQISGLVRTVAVISGILWLLVFLIMAFAFYMIINERRREIGLLRAMGAKRLHVLSLIATEASLLSLGGWTAGIVLGFGLLTTFKDLMLIRLKLPTLLPSAPELAAVIVGAVCLSLFTGVLSAILPSLVIIRADPYDAIRSGG